MNIARFTAALIGWITCTMIAFTVSLPAGLTLLSMPALMYVFK